MISRAFRAFLHRPIVLFVLFGFISTLHAQQAPTTSPPTVSARAVVAPRSNVDMLLQIEKRRKLRVGVSEIVPWTMHNKKGEFIGFEIDVAKKMARDLHVEVEFYPEEFRYLLPDLLANRFDIIIADFSIEASRALQVNFSDPYNVTDVTLAANTKLAGNLKTVDAFNQPGITIGVIEGSTAEELAALDFPKAMIRTYTEASRLFNDLIQGQLTSAVADSPRLDILTKLYPGSVSLPPIPTLGTFPAAFAVRRGDLDFVNYLNSWIAARNADKWLDSHQTYWFKTTDWASSL